MPADRYFLRGEIDMSNAETLERALRTAAAQAPAATEFVVDCMDLEFIDLAGIRALIMVHSELAQQGRDLRVVHPSPILTRMLQVAALTYLLRPTPLPATSN